MGKFKGTVFILLLSMSATLFGDVIYINVTNVRTKQELSYPYKKLKAMGLKMYYKQKSYGYAAYVGPYKSQTTLNEVYKRVKKSFSNARIIVEKQNKQIIDKEQTNKKYHAFVVGLGVGYASAPSTHTLISGSVDVNEPNSSGVNYVIYGGYDFENGLSLLLNYMYLDSSDLEFTNIYSSLNYRFEPVGLLNPYVGVSLGYSSLRWNTSPIALASTTSNNDSDDILYGTQLGFNHYLSQSISLKVDYSCLFLKHTTNITQNVTNVSKIQHNTLHSLLVSLQYSF